jgi:transposase
MPESSDSVCVILVVFEATSKLPASLRHVFYDALNGVLRDANFDKFAESLCGPFYKEGGRRGIPPGIYFRMIFVGYFEGIDSQRGIAWRCGDSLSLRAFLGYELHESTPDHSSMTRIRQRLPLEVFEQVFAFVLSLVEEHGLLKGKTVGVDSTLLEANAAMKSIVRRDTGEDWEAYVRGLAEAEGVEINSDDDLRKFDRKRKGKTASNQDWQSSSDPDARIMKMKKGHTHLSYKQEHTVDLETEVVLSAEIYHGNESDANTLLDSVGTAQGNLQQADSNSKIKEVVGDKGYHKNEQQALELHPLDLLARTWLTDLTRRQGDLEKAQRLEALVRQARRLRERCTGDQSAENVAQEVLAELADYARLCGDKQMADALTRRLSDR